MTDHNTPAVDVSTEAVMRLLDGVTPGPWGCMDYLTDDCARWCIVPPDAVGTIANVHPDPDGIDARFIAASRDLVPAMLSRAEAAEAEVARLREVYWRLRSYATHDDGCKLNKPPRFSGPCSCGLADALKGGEA